MRVRESAVRIVVVHPDLLGTYGDGGNAVVLAQRLRWRGQPAEVVQATSDSPVPGTGDLYCLGGGEDAPQALSVAALAADGNLARAVGQGAVVLAVCAGLQVMGESFPAGGAFHPGLGLLDLRTTPGLGPRAVGELVVEPGLPGSPGDPDRPSSPGDPDRPGSPGDPDLPTLTGYENHAGVTALGPGLAPLGRVVTGTGNGNGNGSVDGAVSGRVLGTYLHGPVLARNPALADLLLSWVVGPLAPLDDSEVDRLRAERLVAARRRSWRRGWSRLGGGRLGGGRPQLSRRPVEV